MRNPADSPPREVATDAGRAHLEALLARRRAARYTSRTSGDGPHELSFMQEGMWFLQQLEPHSTTYNIRLALGLRGRLDGDALAGSLNAIARQHATLRTSFPSVDGVPRQVVHPESAIVVARVDARTWSEATLAARVLEMGEIPFNLEEMPLLRATLLQTGDSDWQLILVVHHIVWDDWSTAIFVRELQATYPRLAAKEQPALPALPLQYTDFVASQRRSFEAGSSSDPLAYWLDRLRGAPPSPVLPKGGVAPTSPRVEGHAPLISPELAERLAAFAQRYEVSVFVLMLTVFEVLLCRLTRQHDLVVAMPVSDRSMPGARRLIGFFSNTIVMRVDLGGDPTFAQAIARVNEAVLGGLVHADVPFSLLVAKLRAGREEGRMPLAQIEFLYDTGRDEALSIGDLHAEWLPTPGAPPPFDLSMQLRDMGPDGMKVNVHSRPDAYDLSTVEALVERFAVLLEAALEHPDARIASLPLIELPSVRRCERGGPLAVSFAQARQLFIWSFAPGSPRFNVPVARRLKGRLDVAALERSVQELVRRHEALRTTFSVADGAPVQIVHAGPASETIHVLARTDVRGGTCEQAHDHARCRVEDANRAFALDAEPPFRATLLVLAEDEHVLVLTSHHIAADPRSMEILFAELSELYAAFVQRRPSPLRELEIQYADFAAWQRLKPVQALYDLQLAYWREALAGAPDLDLPTDRPRPENKRHVGARFRFELGPSVVAKLDALARDNGTTPSVALLTTFGAVLSRWSGREDIVVGTQVEGRSRAEVAATVGPFVNTLPIRMDLREGPSFRELVGRVKAVSRAAIDNQDVPFEQVIDAINPPRDLSRTPIFEASFTFRDDALPASRWPDLDVSAEVVDLETSLFDLSLHVLARGDRYCASVEFDTDLFDRSTIERMAAHFTTLLEGGLEHPEVPVGALPMMGSSEREQVLTRWNASARAYPSDVTFDTLFEAQVARTPAAVAVQCDGAQATYAELSQRAHRVAHELHARGLRRGDVFGLLATRSIEFLAAMIGGWKLGLAYLPLDPKHPPQRIAAVLEQSKVTHVYCEKPMVGLLEEARARTTRPAAIVELRTGAAPATAPTDQRPELAGGVSDLAYVIFTSGSTGAPKGCMLEQRGMINHLFAKITDLGLTAGDVVAQTASQCFDISVWQFLAPLLVGGRTEIFDSDTAMDPKLLLDKVVAAGVTILEPVPSLLRAMLAVEDTTALPLRWCVPTGEALPLDLARDWGSRYPNIPLVNAYGPTECSDDVTHHVIRAGDALPVMSIGRPVQNTRIYVLRDGLPLGIGELGELHVGGVGVGRGYLNHPTLTAERFIPDPFSTTPGARLYRTGDLGRWRNDGTLEFVGRIDHQVKVRGFRIELGDIESALLANSAVHEAIVLAREDVPGDQRLVAYVTPKAGATLDTAALRTSIAEALPVYMIPQALLVLPALPLTPNGKVDRKALPAPTSEDLQAGDKGRGAHVDPRNPLEEFLAELFAKSLKVERVGVTDDFFALGGQSLLVMRIVANIRNVLKKEIRVRDFFEAPTVAKLALRIKALDGGIKTPPLVRRDVPEGSVTSFVHDVLLNWEAQREPSRVWTVARCVDIAGPLDAERMLQAVRMTLERHDPLRQVFDIRVPGFAPRVWRSEDAPIERVDARDWTSERIADFINRQTSVAFAMDGTPLIHFVLLERGPEDHALLYRWHQIVHDPTATAVITDDIVEHYTALSEGRPPNLPALPIRYVDYSIWEREWFLEGPGRKDVEAARKRLVGVKPHDFKNGAEGRPASIGNVSAGFQLAPEAASRFDALRRAHNATPFIAIASVVGVLISRWTGTDDVTFVSPVSLRNVSPELPSIAGRFMNPVVVTFSVAGNPTWREVFARSRAAILDAFSQEWTPISLVLETDLPLSHPFARVALNILPPAAAPPPLDAGNAALKIAERAIPAPSGARGDLVVVVGGDGSGGRIVGAANRFDVETLETKTRELQQLFEQLDLDAPIGPP